MEWQVRASGELPWKGQIKPIFSAKELDLIDKPQKTALIKAWAN
ncbi:hypothetical protein [Dankookia sp. P2]